MILVCGGIKGGSGKTTFASNLAVIRSARGHDVVLIDADNQETSYDFTLLRGQNRNGDVGYLCSKQSGMGVRTSALQFAQKYDTVIIDSGGRDTVSQRAALSVADVVLVPFVPRSFDLWTIEKVAEVLAEVKPANPKLEAYTFLNRADARGQFPALSSQLLREASGDVLHWSGLSVGDRVAFGKAAASGLAITELRPEDPKAIEEIGALYDYVFASKTIAISYDGPGAAVAGGAR